MSDTDPFAAIPAPVLSLVRALWHEGAARVELHEREDTVWLCDAGGARSWSVRLLDTHDSGHVALVVHTHTGRTFRMSGSLSGLAEELRARAEAAAAGDANEDPVHAAADAIAKGTGTEATPFFRRVVAVHHETYRRVSRWTARSLVVDLEMFDGRRATAYVGVPNYPGDHYSFSFSALDGGAFERAEGGWRRTGQPVSGLEATHGDLAAAPPQPTTLEIRAPTGTVIWSGPADGKRAVLLAGRRLLREWTGRSFQCTAWLLDGHGEVEVTSDLAAMRRDADRMTSRAVNDVRASAAAMRRRAEQQQQAKEKVA
ncbi:hypothetical protein CR162_15340 [Pseudoroseomonas rhizosphaerae]|uniref:Uncharacterized protein n=1 Tax=Teichococcus rhizosphaerae TaxID=1335062 RepID=A0A2C7A9S7_9PROT|nr:hypothetical protein [Pseudoroseomonas rhizosphaerae]PHK94135.1 hypothetical protein CR162_15340 [Pseudoroseomonas rhizosphaerae]